MTDVLGRNVRYRYDGNGNRTAVELPGGSGLENLYYGSGHLHRIAFDGETVTDIERDRLHRETGRTQGRLASRYTLDPLGRLKSQLAVPAGPSESKGKAAVTAAVKRSYGYDRTGNLTQSTDPRTGTTQFEYDKLGRITRAGDELFAFDPAHNIVDIPAMPSENMPEGISEAADKAHTATVKDNRIKTYDGAEYYYDTFGNLTFMSLPDGSSRTLSYDLKDRLVLAEIWREGGKEIWRYEYDALDRRIAKEQVEVGEEHRPAADGKGRLKTVPGSRIEFVWDGSRLLQEIHPHGSYTYVYTDQDSYEPLAQICEWEDEAGETRRQVNYFHCDQIGLPREMTDGEGRLLWFGNYGGWGKLTEETNIANAHQPFRLQNQYCDGETGLHYNFFRYYDPHSGRFVTQDPIGLWGGTNFYQFGLNINSWTDIYGLSGTLTIYSTGSGLMDGHSWISYTPDGGGKTTTYGTWGNNPTGKGNGLFTDIEQGRGADATRSMHLDDAAEKRLMSKIDEYKKKGAGAWTLGGPCSSFARDAWKAGTGEDLNSNTLGGLGPVSNPNSLRKSIIKANGGKANAVAASPRKNSSASFGSSGRSSGSSSLNSSGSSL